MKHQKDDLHPAHTITDYKKTRKLQRHHEPTADRILFVDDETPSIHLAPGMTWFWLLQQVFKLGGRQEKHRK